MRESMKPLHTGTIAIGFGTIVPLGMLGMAGVLRSARNNPRFAYVPIDPQMPGATDFATALEKFSAA